MKRLLYLVSLGLVALIAGDSRSALAAEEIINIEKKVDTLGFLEPVPISISGFSGEVDSVLRTDLFFMGFDVKASKPRFELKGSNSGRVEARFIDTVAQKTLLSKAYTGGNIRQQAHVLADEIAVLCERGPGIGQTRIAFCHQPGGVGKGEIYLADYDGNKPTAVTQDGVIVGAPAWAGRGTLLYTSYKFGNTRIFGQNIASGSRHLVANYPGLCDSAAVSPDGNRVAMILSKDGRVDLYVSDLQGNGLQRLTESKDEESSPCWSPDGQTICFVARVNNRAELYTMPASGGRPTRIVGVHNPSEPDWSPDGKFIIYTSNVGGFQLVLLPMTGPLKGQPQALVAGKNPSWAPNSRTVIFTRTASHRDSLSLLDVPRKQTKDIVKLSGSVSEPTWSR